MSMGVALFAWFMLGVSLLLRFSLGRPSKVTLLEYQRGILYRRGQPIKEVGPGQHWVWTGFEKTLYLDTRPLTIGYQNLAVTLSDGLSAAYGVSASAQIIDVRKAMYSSQAYTQVPAFVLLCCVRGTLSENSSLRVRTAQQEIVDEVTQEVRARLDSAGFELLNFRLTHLSVFSPENQ